MSRFQRREFLGLVLVGTLLPVEFQANGAEGTDGRRARKRAAAKMPGPTTKATTEESSPRIVLTDAKTYVIAGGQEHMLAGVTFDVTSDYPDNQLGIDVGDGACIDVLRIRLRPGITGIDRFVRLGSGVRIGRIDVEAATQTALNDQRWDGFLQIRDSQAVAIDTMHFRNIDRCLMIRNSKQVRIGSFNCESYCKGVKIDGSSDVYVGALVAHVASPHAVPHPGFNGLSVSNSHRIELPYVEIEDAAEHAVYVAGGGDAHFSSDLRFGQILTKRSGQCGFKCKAPVSPSVAVSIESLTVIDASWGSRPGPNEDGLRVENCQGFHVGNLNIHREQGRHSCYVGLVLDGVTDFTLDGGYIEDTAGPMVLVEDRRGVDSARLTITGLVGRDIGGDGVQVSFDKGRRLDALIMAEGRIEHAAGVAVRIEGGAQLAVLPSYIRMDSTGGSLEVAPDTSGNAHYAAGGGVIITEIDSALPARPTRAYER
jgi:hypothetical protein